MNLQTMYDLFNQLAEITKPEQSEELQQQKALNGYINMGNYLNDKKAENEQATKEGAPAQPEELQNEPAAAPAVSLSKHRDLAYRAFSGISFSPEKRRDSTIAEFEHMLAEDLAKVPDSYKEKYQMKFEGFFTSWLHSKSRCMSSMITGPARFPVARMQKYNRWEDNKYNEFMAWRKRILAALARSEKKRTQDSELDRAVADLEHRKKAHAIMKSANSIIRKAKGADSCIPDLATLGISESDAYSLLHPKFAYYGQGYASFSLTNNNASIKRLEDRVKMLQAKEAMKVKIEAGAAIPEITINGAIIRKDFTDDRLKIIFDGKPAQNVLTQLKRSGFHWSRFMNCWCRKLTNDAFYVAKKICETDLKPTTA